MGAPGVSNFLQNYIAAGERGQQFRADEAKQNALKTYLPQAMTAKTPEQRLSVTQGLAQGGAFEQAQQYQDRFKAEDAAKVQKELADAELRARPYLSVKTPEDLARVNSMWAQQGVDPASLPKSVGEANFLTQKVLSIKDQIEQQFKAQEFGLKERETNADIALRQAQVGTERAQQSKYYADARTAGRTGQFDPATGTRLLPAGQQKAEDEDVQALGTLQSTNAQIGGLLEIVDSANLGLVNNLTSRGMNLLGVDSEGSQSFALIDQGIQKLRNDVLMLHKGVQTEGDAVRALQTIVTSMNNPNVVKAQLQRLAQLNEAAYKLKIGAAQGRRMRNQSAPFNPQDFGLPGQAVIPQPRASQPLRPSQAAQQPKAPEQMTDDELADYLAERGLQ